MATVANTPRTTTYTLASAGTGPYLTGFRVFEEDAISVYVNGAISVDWVMTTTFLDGYDDNTSITFGTALEIGDVIQIDGAQPAYRDYDYLNGDPGLSRKLNIELGRLWASVSEIAMQAGRSVRTLASVEPSIPEEDSVLIWQGGQFVSGPTADEIANAQDAAVAAAASAVAAADSAAEILALTADATTLAPEAPATAAYDAETGVMSFGIPQGIQGEQGDPGVGLESVPTATLVGRQTAGTGAAEYLIASEARTLLGLGTAATTASTDYATAAQGALADTAVQPDEIPSQLQATWNTGTDTTESTITPAKLDDKIENKLNVTGTAPMYACRAWVNFNGTGTVAIRAAGNVSSITDNGTGDYTVNFTTAMPDADYAVVSIPTRNRTDKANWVYHLQPNDTTEILTTSVRLKGGYVSGTADGNYNAANDFPQVSVAVFR